MSYKKDFVAGDKLPADELTENFTILEPVSAFLLPVPASLVCGTAGDLADFQLVSDGAFKISIDGTEREINNLIFSEDLNSDFLDYQATDDYDVCASSKFFSQSFNTGLYTILNSASLQLRRTSIDTTGTVYCEILLADAEGKPTGSVLGSKTMLMSDLTSTLTLIEFVFDTPITLSENTKYVVKVRNSSSSSLLAVYFKTVGLYSDGKAWYYNGSSYGLGTTQDLGFVLNMDRIKASSLDVVAERIQANLRTLTSGLETVVYDTDHFVFSSVDDTATSAITVLSAPTSGTDISTATYLNGVLGTIVEYYKGSDESVVSTNINGRIAGELITLPIMTTIARDAMADVPTGYLIFNSTSLKLNFYNGSAWVEIA